VRTSAEVAGFDSPAAMFRALARLLHGKDLPALGMVSPAMAALLEPVIGALRVLPRGGTRAGASARVESLHGDRRVQRRDGGLLHA